MFIRIMAYVGFVGTMTGLLLWALTAALWKASDLLVKGLGLFPAWLEFVRERIHHKRQERRTIPLRRTIDGA